MKQEIAKRWVVSLRSDNFIQAQGIMTILKNEGPLWCCCMGELCEIIKDEMNLPTMSSTTADQEYPIRIYSGQKAVLPASVLAYTGIQSENGTIESIMASNGTGADCLTSMNDRGVSRAALADIIEQHWEEL